MTIRNSFPDVRPALNLDFANTKRLDPRITFTRSSTGTYVDEFGVIKTAASNEARFDHDSDGNSLGLLIEESRTNIQQYSATFANWTRSPTATRVLNSSTAPDGTLTATKIVEGVGSQSQYINLTFNSTGTYTHSVFAKAAERQYLYMFPYSSGGNLTHFGVFDLVNGTSYSTNSAYYHKIIPLSNGWYRCVFRSYNGGFGDFMLGISPSASPANGAALPYQGDGSSGLYIWGMQTELASFETSYIPTSGSTATRSADVASMTGTNFSSWYNQSEGSLFAEWVSPDTKQFSSPAIIKESTAKNGPRIYNYAYTGTKLYALVKTPSEHAILLTSSYSPNTQLKTVIAYTTSDMASSFNGNATATASVTTTIPTMTRLDIGDVYATNDRYSNHHIARLTYYDRRLTDAQLQALTL